MRNPPRFSVMALPAARMIAAAAFISACAGIEVTDPSEQVPTEPSTRAVSVSPRLDTLPEGGQLQVQATVTVNGNLDPSPSITWRTTDPAVATVSSTGVVNAVHEGQVYVVATVGTVSDRVELMVVAPDVPVASVVVAPNSANVFVGGTVALAASPRSSTGAALTGRDVTWSSSNNAVATVSLTGVVSGQSPGTAVINATSEGHVGSATIVVSPQPVAVVTLSSASMTVPAGETRSLTAVSRDASGAVLPGRAVSWTTSNSSVATVATNGATSANVSAIAAGSATITATVEGRTATAQVTVTSTAPVPVATVTVSPSTATVAIGATRALSAVLRDAAGVVLSGRAITWSSSANTVATVNSSGLVSGVAQGTATITASSEGRTGTATITVPAPAPLPVATVQVSPSSATVAIGSTQQLSATTRASDGTQLTGRVVTWTSSNTGAATVSGTGMVTAVGAGSTTITATSEGRTGTSAITVPATQPPPPPPPPGTLAFTNLPAGLTLATSADWTNWPNNWVNERASTTGLARLATDATAPMSPSGVLEEFYPTGMSGGTAPGNVIYTGTNGATEVFVGFWFKMSTNFQGHSSGVNKLVNLWTPSDIQWLRVNAWPQYDNDGSRQNGPFYLVATNRSSEFDLLQNQVQTMIPIVPGQWHKVEWHLTTAGAAPGNGRARWWLDGVLVGDYSNLSSTMGSAFSEFQISPTWGGNGDTMSRDSYMRFDHVVIYRR